MGECDADERYYLIARNSQNKSFQFVRVEGNDIPVWSFGEIPYFTSRKEVLNLSSHLQTRGYETHVIEDNTVEDRRFITLETKVEHAEPAWVVKRDFSFLNLFRS